MTRPRRPALTEPETHAHSSAANHKVIFSLFLIHFTGDFYFSFALPLMPVLARNLALSLTQIGLITGFSRLLAFVVQPPVGYLADRYRTRFFVLGGPLIAAVSIPMLGEATGFWTVLLFVSLASAGCSMFHPPAAGMVLTYAGRNISFSMSLFQLGGTAAFGAGPVFVAWYVSRYGMNALPLAALPGLAAVVWLYFIVPQPEGEGLRGQGLIRSIRQIIGPVWKPIAILWFLALIRAFISQSFLTFSPILFDREGFSLVSIGGIVASYTIAGAVSGLLAGHLADRIGYKPIFYAAFGLAAPCLYFFIQAHGVFVYLGSFSAGFMALATMPLSVTMAQEM
ncbi:MAG: MFS transporter, partial [Proteobacteria bacterium]|nr:MFS transporter [Pseudomonadota bacterium]